MKKLLLLAILAVLLTTFAVIYNESNQRYTPQKDGESQDDLEQGALIFAADPQCSIGSKYVFGTGCEESLFLNVDSVNKNEMSMTTTVLENYILTSASEINQYVSLKIQNGGSGWFTRSSGSYSSLEKSMETVNSISIAMTDFRSHKYYYSRGSEFIVDDFEVDDFQMDPDYFFQMNGYYFVTGYTTSSSFNGVLNYYSESKEALKEVHEKITKVIRILFIKITRTSEFHDISQSSSGHVEESSAVNVTGSTNQVWDQKDIGGSYEKYQNTIDKETMQTVTLAKYDALPQFRQAIRDMDDENKNKLRDYTRISNQFFQKMSQAFGIYYLNSQMVSEHIIKYGNKISQQQLDQLYELKRTLDHRLTTLSSMTDIKRISQLRNDPGKLLEYELMSVEVEKFLKQISGRND